MEIESKLIKLTNLQDGKKIYLKIGKFNEFKKIKKGTMLFVEKSVFKVKETPEEIHEFLKKSNWEECYTSID